MLESFLIRARALLARRAADAELDEELRYHLERDAERLMASGMTAHDAHLASRRAFGNVGVLKDEVRDSWGVRWLERLAEDVRFALRSFRHNRMFAAAVVLTIALALGLNTVVFTIFDVYVLRPVGVRDSGSLYEAFFGNPRVGTHRLTWGDFERLRGAVPAVVEESFAYTPTFARSRQRPMFGQLVSADAFRVMGAVPALGRPLLPEDGDPHDPDNVMVLSHDAWVAQFGADSSIIGTHEVVNGVPLTVVGVAAPSFTGIGAIPPDFWAPIGLLSQLGSGVDLESVRSPATVHVVVRLRPAVDARQGTAALAAWSAGETSDRRDSLRLTSVQLMSLASVLPLTAETIAIFAPAAVAFLLILIIACANVANLMLARGITRQREIGVRLSLGASRARVVRQLLTESVLLALPAAAVGYLLSRWTIDSGVRLLFATMPADYAPYMRIVPLAPDLRVFVFLLAAAVVAAMLFGLAPALQATRPNIVQASRGDFDSGMRAGRARGGLVTLQIALSALLLICTGVLLRGARAASRAPTGLETHRVLQIDLDDRWRDEALRRLATRRDVATIGAASSSALDGMYPALGMHAGGSSATIPVAFDFVNAGFFDALDIRVFSGRSFTDQEQRDGAPVAIVSEATALRLWPGRSALGQIVQLAGDPPRESPLARMRTARVIGIARNSVSGWIGAGLDRPVVYYPSSAEARGMRILARVNGKADDVREHIDGDFDAALPGAIREMHTLDSYLAVQTWPFQLFSEVASALGGIALLLTLAGVYGVPSYVVAQRTKEIGIRMALGANVAGVMRLVLSQSMRYAVIGLFVGTVLALLVSKAFASILYVVDTFDPVGYAFGAGIVLVGCLAAAAVPSRRAAKVSPVEALRTE